MTDRSKTHSASRGGRKADRSPVSRKKKLTRKDRIRQIRLRILAVGLLILMILILIFVRYLGLRNGRAVHLSEEVLAYQPVVEQSCKEYGIPSFSQVILAIMQQESAGQVADVMQSSESPFNTQYSNAPGSITDPNYSIQVGVETFAHCLDEAHCSSPADQNGLKLALQFYNFGGDYASWALENYGGYTPENAAEYSLLRQQALGWSQYGDPEYVPHVMQYYHYGL